MSSQAVFLVRNERDKHLFEAFCPEAVVKTASTDFDALDFSRQDVVLVGGVDFISTLAQRLHLQCMCQADARFTCLLPPHHAGHADSIRSFLDTSGLTQRYNLIFPYHGFLHAVEEISNAGERSTSACIGTIYSDPQASGFCRDGSDPQALVA